MKTNCKVSSFRGTEGVSIIVQQPLGDFVGGTESVTKVNNIYFNISPFYSPICMPPIFSVFLLPVLPPSIFFSCFSIYIFIYSHLCVMCQLKYLGNLSHQSSCIYDAKALFCSPSFLPISFSQKVFLTLPSPNLTYFNLILLLFFPVCLGKILLETEVKTLKARMVGHSLSQQVC